MAKRHARAAMPLAPTRVGVICRKWTLENPATIRETATITISSQREERRRRRLVRNWMNGDDFGYGCYFVSARTATSWDAASEWTLAALACAKSKASRSSASALRSRLVRRT